MSTTICQGCGRITNSATSNWWLTVDYIPTKCYIAWENNKAVQGCHFNQLTREAQNYYQTVIDDWNKNAFRTVDEYINTLNVGQ